MQDAPTADGQLGDGFVARAILEAVLTALVEYWWLWLAMIAVAIVLRLLNGWSKRVEARSCDRRSR